MVISEGMLRAVAPNARLPFQVNVQLENERGKFCKYDAVLGWIGRPNVSDEFVSLDCSHPVQQNQYGFRGAAYPFKRSQKKRIVVVGDSFVWGYGVKAEQMFTTRMEQRSVGPALEVVNCGVSGYGTDQELLLYRQFGRRFQADHVLLVVTPYTDLWDNITPTLSDDYPKPMFKLHREGNVERLELTNVPVPQRAEAWSSDPRLISSASPILSRLAAHSSVLATVINTLATYPSTRAWLESERIMSLRDSGDDTEILTHLAPLPAQLEESCDVLFALIREFKAEVNRDGRKLTILLVPSVADVDSEMWEILKARINSVQTSLPVGSTSDRDQIRRRFLAFCDRSGLEVIDPTDALREAAKRDRYVYFPWNGHWTAAGHRIVGELLLKRFAPSDTEVSP